VTFCSPVFADDPALASFAASYLNCTARSVDGKDHGVVLYIDCSAEWAVHEPTQEVTWSRGERDDGPEKARGVAPKTGAAGEPRDAGT
jgi:hypothetical protein